MTSITSSSSSHTVGPQWETLGAKQYFDQIEHAIKDKRFIQALDLYDLMIVRDILTPVSEDTHLSARFLQITKSLIFYDLIPSESIESSAESEIICLPPRAEDTKNTKIEEIEKLVRENLKMGKFAKANGIYRYAVYYKLFQSANPQINEKLSKIKKTLEIAMLRCSKERFKLYKNPTIVLLQPRIPPSAPLVAVKKKAEANNTGAADSAAKKENKTEQEKKGAQTSTAKPKCGKLLPGKIYPLLPTEKRKGEDIEGRPLNLVFYR